MAPPLQYSYLANPMDGGAWWAAVYGVTKSQTRLRDFTFTFPFHVLEKEMATHSSVPAWRIPGTGEPGGLLSMGLHRVGHDWSALAAAAAVNSSCCGQDFQIQKPSWGTVLGPASSLYGSSSLFCDHCLALQKAVSWENQRDSFICLAYLWNHWRYVFWIPLFIYIFSICFSGKRVNITVTFCFPKQKTYWISNIKNKRNHRDW